MTFGMIVLQSKLVGTSEEYVVKIIQDEIFTLITKSMYPTSLSLLTGV